MLRQPLEVMSKGAAGPVTNVDLAVDAMLREKLRAARPDYGWLSEETPDAPEDRLHHARVFMLDPIDGTAAMIAKSPQWTISIGVVESGRAVAGAIYNPMTDEMFVGGQAAGVSLNGRSVLASGRTELVGARVIGERRRYADKRWPQPWPDLDISYRQSIAYRLALVASGQADLTILFGPKHDWDIAAGAALIAAAGGTITDPWGGALTLNRPEPRTPGAVAAGAGLHALIIERTSHLPNPKEANGT